MIDSNPVITGKDYQKSAADLQTELSVEPADGLSVPEAEERLKLYGLNELALSPPPSWWRILLNQLRSPVVWVLCAAAAVSAFFEEWLQASAIGAVLLINTTLGFVMEWQARRSVEALKRMARIKARVRRAGREETVDAQALVPGDILLLEAGDVVAADGRLLEQSDLAVKEAMLTGESLPVEKDCATLAGELPISEHRNMVYKGTVITRGRAVVLITATGRNSELGRIGHLTAETEKDRSPLEKKLARLSRRLIVLTLILTVVITLLGLAQGRDWLLMIETAVALAVAAIPEGLPIVATIALAHGMLLLVREQVIVKGLQAVQTLGEVKIICTDKTGTLTTDEMTMDQGLEASPSHATPSELANYGTNYSYYNLVGLLCNDAEYRPGPPEYYAGDPMEVALLRKAFENNLPVEKIREHWSRVAEIPFNSEHRYMATLHRGSENYLVAMKGAVEAVLAHCHRQGWAENEVALDINFWNTQARLLAETGLRVLAVAAAERKNQEADFCHHLQMLGLITFWDPPRKEVPAAIETCSRAGIKVVMVTGDYLETAMAIARKVGIKKHGEDKMCDGLKLTELLHSKDGLNNHVGFARVSPAQKLQLVEHYRQQDQVVAMTGDGVNDAPALKKADIGIAMGIRGTEAAREAADLILKNDSFSSIVSAVEQGRVIFHNIRYFVIYLLSCNISEILIVAVASIAMLPMPLLPLQILFLNIVTDIFPALALGLGRGNAQLMRAAPRRSSAPLLTRQQWWSILGYGVAITSAVIGLVIWASLYWHLDDHSVNNLAFYTLVLAQLWQVFNLPDTSQSFWRNEVTRNRHLWLALLFCLLLTVFASLLPAASKALSLHILPLNSWLLVLAFSLLPTLFIQLFKRLKLR